MVFASLQEKVKDVDIINIVHSIYSTAWFPGFLRSIGLALKAQGFPSWKVPSRYSSTAIELRLMGGPPTVSSRVCQVLVRSLSTNKLAWRGERHNNSLVANNNMDQLPTFLQGTLLLKTFVTTPDPQLAKKVLQRRGRVIRSCIFFLQLRSSPLPSVYSRQVSTSRYIVGTL